MRLRKTIVETLSLLMLLAVPVSSAVACGGEAAQSASSSCEDSRQALEIDRLLSILVQKRLLSPNEAANVRAEVKENEQESSSISSAVQRNPVDPCRNQAVPSAKQTQSSPLEQRVQEVNAKLPFEIGGYGQVQWDSWPGSGSTFLIRRGRISVDGHIRQLANYKIQIEALNSPALLDAYLQLKPRHYANFTFGQFKVPFSQASQRSSSDLFTVERPQVVNSLVPGRDNGSQGRDVGADVGGSYNFAHFAGVDYALGIFDGAGIDRKDDNNRKDFAARLSLRPFRGLALAGDYYNGAAGSTELARDRQEGEIAYARRSLTLLGEFIWGRDGATHKQGWYGLAAWRFSSPWEAVFRVDGYDPDRSKANNTTTTYLGGLNWYFACGLRWQVNEGLQSQRSTVKNAFLSQLQFRF